MNQSVFMKTLVDEALTEYIRRQKQTCGCSTCRAEITARVSKALAKNPRVAEIEQSLLRRVHGVDRQFLAVALLEIDKIAPKFTKTRCRQAS